MAVDCVFTFLLYNISWIYLDLCFNEVLLLRIKQLLNIESVKP